MGLGEMGLTPEVFWALTYREFQVKFEGFSRAEDRRRALMFEYAAIVGKFGKDQTAKLYRNMNQLRRYPIKPWLRPE